MIESPPNQARRRFLRPAVPPLTLALLLAAVLLAPAVLAPGRAAPQTATVSLDPPTAEGSVGTSVEVDVRSDGASNVYGAQFTVQFDPASLQVEDANPAQAGVQIATGACPAPDFVAANSADNSAGTAQYAATQLNPTPACSGGVIATVSFLCLDIGATEPFTVPVSFVESILSDPNGSPIVHDAQDGQVVCSADRFRIEGQAAPQAHTGNAAGVQVCLDGATCVTTGSDGHFSFMALAGESHTVTADFEAHLLSQKSGITASAGQTVDVGKTTLRAGDLNADGAINILDLVMVGGNFNRTQPTTWQQ